MLDGIIQSSKGSLSVSPRTASASTVSAFNDSPHFQFAFGHSTDAVGSEVGVPRLDAPQAAEVLITLFLPLCNQVFVSVPFLDAVFIKLSADSFSFIEEIEDVTCFLMVNSEDRPKGFHFPLPFMRLSLRFSHLLIQLIQRGLDQLPAIGGRLPAPLHFGHCLGNEGALQGGTWMPQSPPPPQQGQSREHGSDGWRTSSLPAVDERRGGGAGSSWQARVFYLVFVSHLGQLQLSGTEVHY